MNLKKATHLIFESLQLCFDVYWQHKNQIRGEYNSLFSRDIVAALVDSEIKHGHWDFYDREAEPTDLW